MWKKTALAFAISLTFHLSFLYSIFDIYFVSQVVQVHQRFGKVPQDTELPAKRLVLFVGDGLRADKLLQLYPSPPFDLVSPLPSSLQLPPYSPDRPSRQTTPAPYLRSLIESGKARWGISHTRVPTESRPGHVALIGGMYEDVSAVLKGWKLNPVDFDSVFNQSTVTYSFGSPDILPMFKEGASPKDKVYTWTYEEDEEDFSADAVGLDIWVQDRMIALLNEDKLPLKREGTVFFLHLLGLDTTGHAYRPHSMEYYRNIQAVDAIVYTVQKRIEQYYGDDKTAYVFTSDHGMSAIGNHGDGHPDNTETPLIVWGSGVEQPDRSESEGELKWGLKGRSDVDQADVAGLMSALLGINIPANSEGRIPLDYLGLPQDQREQVRWSSVRQRLEQFMAKSDILARKKGSSFRPFKKLQGPQRSQFIQSIEKLLADGKHDEAALEMEKLYELTTDGVRYLHTYDWLILKTLVYMGYFGSMASTAIFIFKNYVSKSPPPQTNLSWAVGITVFASLAAKFMKEEAPFTFFLYAFYPCLFWSYFFSNMKSFQDLRSQVSFPTIVLVICGMQAIVIGYFNRQMWSAAVFISCMWVSILFEDDRQAANISDAYKGFALLTLGFPLIDVNKEENLLFLLGGAVAFVALGLYVWMYSGIKIKRVLGVQISLVIAAYTVSAWSSYRLRNKMGLGLVNQYLGWLVFGLSLLVPVFFGVWRSQHYLDRLCVMLYAFAPPFIILSISDETMFLFCFVGLLYFWLQVEIMREKSMVHDDSIRKLDVESIRIAGFFVGFLHLAFFGTGNVASISSFYLEPVYRLIPVFKPFLMSSLLLFKIFIPFLCLSAIFTILNRKLHLPPFALFFIVLALSDILSINFFFMIQTEGSWLEIGQTISHFAISNLLILFTTILFWLGEGLMASASLA